MFNKLLFHSFILYINENEDDIVSYEINMGYLYKQLSCQKILKKLCYKTLSDIKLNRVSKNLVKHISTNYFIFLYTKFKRSLFILYNTFMNDISLIQWIFVKAASLKWHIMPFTNHTYYLYPFHKKAYKRKSFLIIQKKSYDEVNI